MGRPKLGEVGPVRQWLARTGVGMVACATALTGCSASPSGEPAGERLAASSGAGPSAPGRQEAPGPQGEALFDPTIRQVARSIVCMLISPKSGATISRDFYDNQRYLAGPDGQMNTADDPAQKVQLVANISPGRSRIVLSAFQRGEGEQYSDIRVTAQLPPNDPIFRAGLTPDKWASAANASSLEAVEGYSQREIFATRIDVGREVSGGLSISRPGTSADTKRPATAADITAWRGQMLTVVDTMALAAGAAHCRPLEHPSVPMPEPSQTPPIARV